MAASTSDPSAWQTPGIEPLTESDTTADAVAPIRNLAAPSMHV